MGSYMPFITAGLAWTRSSFGNQASLTSTITRVTQVVDPVTGAITETRVPIGAPTFNRQDGSRTRFAFGYALGAGVEFAVTSNLMVRVEGQHIRFSDVGDSSVSINTARAGAAVKF